MRRKDSYNMAVIALTAALSGLWSGCASTDKMSEEKQNRNMEQAFMDAKEKHELYIQVNQMYPQNYRSRTLNSDYSLELRNDSVFSHLPYLGQVYSPMPGTFSPGLTFDAPVWNLEQKEGSKGQTIISFDTRTYEDNYTYTLKIWPNGTASINVQASRRQQISFQGNLETKKQK